MGGKWKMPTKDDFQELHDNTTRKTVTINGKKGILLTSNINGKSIFIGFCGTWGCFVNKFYNSGFGASLRSSEVSPNNSTYALQLYCDSGGYWVVGSYCRANGYSVRGVLKL